MKFHPVFLLLFTALFPVLAAGRPNVIFLLVDDMGYADVGVYGNTYHQTPHIDRLAAEGMRFTDAYAAAPNCSPTRGSILTGHWPARTGVTQYLAGNFLPHAKLFQAQLPDGLPLRETLIAQPLRAAGYATASIGKWHLGAGEYLPEKRGFDLNFAGSYWGHHAAMFAPYKVPDIPDATPGEYLTDRLTRESERFIEANRDRPFFLYLPLYAVHSPIEAKARLIEKYKQRTDPTGRNNATYAAMVEGVDQCVSRLTRKLAELGLTGRTIIFFFSDNGGVEGRAFNGCLRRGKGWLYEGGIREPLIIKWPGVTKPGAVSRTPVSSVDFYPTILAMTGVSDTHGHLSDGLSLTPLLTVAGPLERSTLYWHYPHYSNAGASPTGAIREGEWKLIEFFEDNHLELYNLKADPGEQHNLAPVKSKLARRLLEKLRRWRTETGAQMPVPNPDYVPAKAKMKRGIRARWDRHRN